MFFQSRFMIISAVCVVALCACKPSDQPNNQVAATVNGTVISQSRVDMLSKQSTAQGQPDSPEMHKRIIDQLTMQYLLSLESIKKGLDKTPEVLDQIDLTRQSILAKAYVQDYLKNSTVSDDMIKAEYEKIKVQMAGNEYKARHILVDKEADARSIIAQLKKNPKAFESLAKGKSKDSGSKGNGGDLGWFDPHTMVPEFGAALAKLTKGKFTEEPVKTQFGYHVILLEDIRPKVFPPLEAVKPQLKQQIQEQSLQKMLDDLKAKAKVEIVQAAASSVPPTDKALPNSESKPAEGHKAVETSK
jgi:peptidyl-prolyl cis-trans isomerase C